MYLLDSSPGSSRNQEGLFLLPAVFLAPGTMPGSQGTANVLLFTFLFIVCKEFLGSSLLPSSAENLLLFSGLKHDSEKQTVFLDLI